MLIIYGVSVRIPCYFTEYLRLDIALNILMPHVSICPNCDNVYPQYMYNLIQHHIIIYIYLYLHRGVIITNVHIKIA